MKLTSWAARWGVPEVALAELRDYVFTEPDPETMKGGPAGSEAEQQRLIRLEASRRGLWLSRNNNGAATDQHGRHIRYGLFNDSIKSSKRTKSSDLIGIGPKGLFVAVEVKRAGWAGPENSRDEAQARFLDLVNSRGGRGIFATGPNDLEQIT